MGVGGHWAPRIRRILSKESVERGRDDGVVLDVASKEVTEAEERPDGFVVDGHIPVVGISLLVRIHSYEPGVDVEPHDGGVVGPQSSFFWVDFQLVLFKEGKNLCQV